MKGIHGVVLFLCIWCCIKSFNSYVLEHRVDLIDDRQREIYLKDIPKIGWDDVARHKQILELESEVNRLRLRVERLDHEAKHR